MPFLPNKRPRSTLPFARNTEWMQDARQDIQNDRLNATNERRRREWKRENGVPSSSEEEEEDGCSSEEDAAARALLEMQMGSHKPPAKAQEGRKQKIHSVRLKSDRKPRSKISRRPRRSIGKLGTNQAHNSSDTSDISQYGPVSPPKKTLSNEKHPPRETRTGGLQKERNSSRIRQAEFRPQISNPISSNLGSRQNAPHPATERNLNVGRPERQKPTAVQGFDFPISERSRRIQQLAAMNYYPNGQEIATPSSKGNILAKGNLCPAPSDKEAEEFARRNFQGANPALPQAPQAPAPLEGFNILPSNLHDSSRPRIRLELALPIAQPPVPAKSDSDGARPGNSANKIMVNPRGGNLTVLASDTTTNYRRNPAEAPNSNRPPLGNMNLPPVRDANKPPLDPNKVNRATNLDSAGRESSVNQRTMKLMITPSSVQNGIENLQPPPGTDPTVAPDLTFGLKMFSAMNPTVITTGHFVHQEPPTSQV